MPPQHIEIIGGGLAGLATGILLRQQGIPATLHEAGAYPRHRVCGEFLCGLPPDLVEKLGMDDIFAGAATNRSCAWFHHSPNAFFHNMLPAPVSGISRHRLDHAMAGKFVALGGILHTHSRPSPEPAPARVLACGRQQARHSRWTGLKSHFTGLALEADLEIHLGKGGYIGLTRIEDGRVNACGLFPTTAMETPAPAARRLATAAAAIGLPHLAARLDAADFQPASLCGCTAFIPGWQSGHTPSPDALALGDALAMIPPFTGNGMTMALTAADAIAPMLARFANGGASWRETTQAARWTLHQQFHTRMRWAALAHPVLTHPSGQALLRGLARVRLLPFATLFRLTH